MPKFLIHTKLFFLLSLILLSFSTVHAQKKWNVAFEGTLTIGGKRAEGINVIVLKNGVQSTSVTSNKMGKYAVTLEPNNDYLIKFSRAGLVTKSISVNTKNVPEDAIGIDGFQFFIPADVTMLENIPGVNFSVLNQPIGKFSYDPETKELNYDEAYTESILSRIEDLTAQYEEKLKAEEERLAAEKERTEKYNAAVAKGDKAFSGKDYSGAKAAFNEAAALKPSEKYPKDKISEIDKLLADQNKEKELNDKYNAAIAKGDKAFTAKDYTTAKAGYNEALALKSAEAYPKSKISEIDKLLGDLAAKEAADKAAAAKEKELNDKYNAAIAKGDKAFTAKDYTTAKAGYNEAITLKSAEAYPKSKITEIDKLLADLANKEAADKAAAAKEKELNDKYNAAIAKGDKALTAKDYTTAKAGYNEALALKSAEAYPKSKITEIDKLLGDIAAKEAADKAAAAKEKELNDKYNAAIAQADKAFAAKDYKLAQTGYNEASRLKVNEAYPKGKLSELDKIFADLATKEAADKAAAAKEKELNDKYNAAIAKGDKAFTAKDYTAARAGYNEALALKSAEVYPKSKITEIDKLLGDLAAKEAADKAAAAKEKELNDKYNAAIAKGDKAFTAKDYTTAKAGYNEALALKSAEAYPKSKITEIDKLLADLANKEAADKAAAAKEKELNDKYNAAIAKGDKAFTAKDYTAARAGYNEALALKSAEAYPKSKITEIDKLLADLANKEAADKAAAAKEKELNDKYNAAIAKGDKAFTAKDYTTAKAGYNEALALKSAEAYPKSKITEIDKLLADLANKEAADKAAAAKEKELNDKYNAAIAKGDKAFTAKDYTTAKAGYNEALALKSAEAYPKSKITEIDKLLADLANKEAADKAAAAKEKELNDKYNAAIAKGDKAFTAKDYTAAKAGYNEALVLKSAEAYPKSKITEIDKLLAELANKEAADKAAAAKEKELNDKYNAAIAKGDKAFTAKDYTTAKAGYNEALALKSAEAYPKSKITEIDKLLAELANKEAADKAAAAKEKELNDKYKSAISRGDQAFASKEYNTAKASYKEALAIKANEKYPNDRIAEIDDILAEAARAKDVEAKYKNALSKGDRALLAKDYPTAKSGYNEALAIKPNEQYPRTKLSEIDRILAEIAAKSTAKETPPVPKTGPKSAMGMKGKEKDEFINALALKYPQGVTEETYEEAGKKVIRRVVVKGNIGAEYTKVIQSWGTYYFKNGDLPISQYKWDTETKP